MPRILAPSHSFHRRGSQHSLSSRVSRSSRTSLNSEPPLGRNSLSSRGYQNAAYESAFSLRRKGDARRQTSYDVYNARNNEVTQQAKQNAQWDLQDPRQTPSKTLSKESLNTTASTQASSQSSSESILPNNIIGTSASGLAAAFALLMQQKTGRAAPKRQPEPQSVPCSPNPPSTLTSTLSSSFDPYCMIKEEPDCWGQFVDVQSAAEDLERRSRVIRRRPGAPNSLPRY